MTFPSVPLNATSLRRERVRRRLLVAAALLAASVPLSLDSLILESASAQTPPPPTSAPDATASYNWFDPIIETRLLLAAAYVDGTDDEAMQEAALGAMVASIGDPYTVYVPPQSEREFNKELRGTYVGIGAEIDIHENYLRIVTPLDDSPAQHAGVMAGDLVLAIGSESTLGMSADDCMDLLLGEEGTPVTITVRHADGREQDLTITRARIQAQTVKGFRRTSHGWEHMIDPANGIAYLRLTQFTETSPEAVRDAVNAVKGKGAKGLVIDLRFNGGGVLGAAIQIADLFLDKGSIVSLRNRDGQGRAWSAAAQPSDIDLPLVVLINEGSASASEILSGALQDNARAKILGTRSFGKGSVQDVRELPGNHGAIKLTTARYYLPSGRNITRSTKPEDADKPWGVDPDSGFHVPMTDDQERAMFIARRAWEIPDGMPAEPSKWSDPAWVAAAPGEKNAEGLGDLQLAAAMTALRGMLAEGQWPRVGDDPGAQATVSDELQRARSYRERLIRELEATDKRIAELASDETPPLHTVPKSLGETQPPATTVPEKPTSPPPPRPEYEK
jgi:carboxyl-terminal processing protease